MPPSDTPPPDFAPPPAPRGLGTRRTGMLLAVGMGMISTGVILLLFLRSGHSGPGSGSRLPIAPHGPGATPPADITQAGLQRGGQARVQFVDRNDPARTAGQLEWKSLEPQEGGFALVQQPTGTIFTRDGSVVLVKAATARLFTPPRASEPESGTFSGDVTVRLFRPRPDGALDVAVDPPALTFTTRSLSFDLALGEATTRESWSLDSDLVKASGRGIRAIGNFVINAVELLELQQTDPVTINPAADRSTRRATADRPADQQPVSGPPSPPVISIYRATLSDDVRVEQAGRSIQSDALELLLRLVDNRLPEDAIRGVSPEDRRAADQQPATLPWPGVVHPRLAVARPGAIDPARPITLAWSGPLVLRRIEQAPAALGAEQVLARFTAERSGLVRMSDPASAAGGTAPVLTYGATSRTLALLGPSPDSVTLNLGQRGELLAERFTQNLGSGIGQVVGAGSITLQTRDDTPAGEPGVPPPPMRLAWTDQADFVFATANGWMSDRLSQAMFSGSVVAGDARTRLAAGFIRADFEPAPARDGGPVRMLLSRLAARDNVNGDGGPAGSLRAQTLDVAFAPAPDGRTSDPTFITASGSVEAARDGDRLAADRLEASLERDAAGKVSLRSVEAESNVAFRSRDGAAANADRLTADARTQQIDLFGPMASVSSQGATVVSPQIALNGAARTLTTPGPGIFRFVRPQTRLEDGSVRQAVSLEATWSRSMSVDDAAGTATCIGDAVAVSAGTPDEIDTVRGDRILLSFTPFAPGTADGRPVRRLIRAEALGSIVDREGGSPATLESRRYAASTPGANPGDVGAAGRTLERLVYLESPRLIADDAAGVFSAPQPGRILVDDRSPAPPAGAGAPDAMRHAATDPRTPAILPEGGARGTTLFTWSGQASLARATGLATLDGGVRIIHRARADQAVTTLDSDRAEALLASPSPGESAAVGQLVRATALGSVRAENDKRTLQCDQLTFDTVLNQITAESAPGNRVTFLDPQRGSPQTARKLIWTLGPTPEVRIVEPTTTLPR
ncbi:MAG: hypothetical protein JNJ48_07145 [Phycisphaerae bacterium]|nr:hypothetical protein [Phycisphaerae bacterium]